MENEFLFCKILQRVAKPDDLEFNSKDVVFEDTNIYVEHTEEEVKVPVIRRIGANGNKIATAVYRWSFI